MNEEIKQLGAQLISLIDSKLTAILTTITVPVIISSLPAVAQVIAALTAAVILARQGLGLLKDWREFK